MSGQHFLIAMLVALYACGGRQERRLVLADYPAESRVPGATVVPRSDRTHASEFRVLGMSVPLMLEWNVARDAEECLQPARFRAQRTGGDSRVVVDSVMVENDPCWRSQADSVAAATARVSIAFRARRGLSSASGDVLLGRLDVDGRFIPFRPGP